MTVVKTILFTILTILAGIGVWALYVIWPSIANMMAGGVH